MVTWLGYAVTVAILLAVGALLLEKLCERTGSPRRFGWLAGLSLALVIPLTASPRAPAVDVAPAATGAQAPAEEPYWPPAPPEPATPLEAGIPGDPAATGGGAAERAALVLWGSTSLATLLLLCSVLIAAALARRRWDRRRIADEDVYVSRRFGPALVGVARPEIVIPRWVVRLGNAVGATVVRHEREHARARDHLVLLYGGIAVALMPWNPAVWWMFLRLRTAVEVDCDRRVLASGVSPAEYGDLLLDIGARRPGRTFFALAMASSGSMLERRLKAMRNQGIKARRSILALLGCAALSAVAIACGVPAPTGIAPAVNAALAEPVEAGEEAATDAAQRAEEVRAAEAGRQEREQALRDAEQTVQGALETLRGAQQASQETEQALHAAEAALQERAEILLERLERAMQQLEAARAAHARRVSAARRQDDLDRILHRLSELLEELNERSEDAKWMREAADELLGELEGFRSGAQRMSAVERAGQEATREYAERVAEARERSVEARRQAAAARERAGEEREEAAVKRAEATTAREEANAVLQRAVAAHRAATGEAARAAAATRRREAMLRVLTAASAEQEAALHEALATWRASAAAALAEALAELEKTVAEYRSG
ncbi:MAG: hypothetical protein F4059_07465, partial [Gemmatimonadetes bacterium]|nr:hypothetical protein [Gemmatimonadota bacterium]